jgi:hypothetical protein
MIKNYKITKSWPKMLKIYFWYFYFFKNIGVRNYVMTIVIATINKLEMHQIIIKLAFLNGDIVKEVYMEQSHRLSFDWNTKWNIIE